MNVNDNVNVTQWSEEKLSALDPGAGWQPDTMTGLARFRGRRIASGARRRHVAWTLAAATVLSVSLPAFSVTRTFAARCVDACVDVTARVGQLFRPAPTETSSDATRWLATPALRPRAPAVALSGAKGDRVDLAALRGQVVLVNFWATWCPPCKVEIPWFNEFQTNYRDRGLTVVGIALDDDGWTSVGPFAEAAAINYRLALGTEEVSKAFGGIAALPATFLIDRQGRIAAKHVGIVSKAEYELEVARLVAER